MKSYVASQVLVLPSACCSDYRKCPFTFSYRGWPFFGYHVRWRVDTAITPIPVRLFVFTALNRRAPMLFSNVAAGAQWSIITQAAGGSQSCRLQYKRSWRVMWLKHTGRLVGQIIPIRLCQSRRFRNCQRKINASICPWSSVSLRVFFFSVNYKANCNGMSIAQSRINKAMVFFGIRALNLTENQKKYYTCIEEVCLFQYKILQILVFILK